MYPAGTADISQRIRIQQYQVRITPDLNRAGVAAKEFGNRRRSCCERFKGSQPRFYEKLKFVMD